MHRRKSIRLKEYDYSSAGLYFITVCIQDRLCLMGEITNGQMILNDAGKMVQMQWSELPQRFPEIVVDEFTVMPNHFHGIIINDFETIESVGVPLVDARNGISETQKADTSQRAGTRPAPTKSAPSLGEIIGAFKSLTTNEYIQVAKITIGQCFLADCGNVIIFRGLFGMKRN